MVSFCQRLFWCNFIFYASIITLHKLDDVEICLLDLKDLYCRCCLRDADTVLILDAGDGDATAVQVSSTPVDPETPTEYIHRQPTGGRGRGQRRMNGSSSGDGGGVVFSEDDDEEALLLSQR